MMYIDLKLFSTCSILLHNTAVYFDILYLHFILVMRAEVSVHQFICSVSVAIETKLPRNTTFL